jgi:hypothetical protein
VTRLVTVIILHIGFRSLEIVAFPLIPWTSTTSLAIRSPESTSSASSALAATSEVCAINGIFVVKIFGFVGDFDFGVEFGGFRGMDFGADCLLEREQSFSERANEREIDLRGGHRRDCSGGRGDGSPLPAGEQRTCQCALPWSRSLSCGENRIGIQRWYV